MDSIIETPTEKPAKKPVLTIITVCYNEKNVERTCESIIGQTFQDFEWVVIDGGSGPETLAILEKYKKRLDIFISEKDKGVYDAMNKGIGLAGGIWLNFMNAGDTFFDNSVLEKIFLKNIVQGRTGGLNTSSSCPGKVYSDYNGTDVLYGTSRSILEDGTFTLQKLPKDGKLNHAFWQSNCLNHQACFFKKELFEKFGPYNEKYKIRADFEKMLLFLKRGCKFRSLKSPVSNFYMDGISSKNTELLEAETDEIMAEYFPLEYKTIRTIKFLGKIPVARIKERRDHKNRRLVFLKKTLLEWKTRGK